MALRLIIEDDEGNTEVLPLGREAITIGRQEGNTIQLTEKNVSRRHARLTPDGDHWVVEDLGSYNGVKLNGHGIEGRALLQEGDVVQIGDYHLALSEDADRRTVNYEGPPVAANDTVDMVLATSSNDLPKLSAEELAALQPDSFSASPTFEPDLDDPGSSTVTALRPRQSTGVLIGFALVITIALGGGGLWLATAGRLPGGWFGGQAASEATASREAIASKSAANAGSLTAQNSLSTARVQPDPVSKAVVPPPDLVIDEQPTVDPQPSPQTSSLRDDPPTPRKPRSRPRPERKPPERVQEAPAEPATPALVPEQPEVPTASDSVYEDAKAELYRNKNYTRAFELAKQAWSVEHSQRSAALMATAACKMGDAAKARFAVSKLKGAKKDQAVKVCELYQVSL